MPVTPRPRASVLGAFLEGWRRALGAPAVTASLLAATCFLALPLAMALRATLELQSEIHYELRIVDEATLAAERARELGRLIDRELGFFASPAAISHWLRHDPSSPILAGIAAYAALWLFVTGGILDRFARGRPIFTAAFFAACGVYFARFLRLAVFIGAAYFILFRWLYPLLFETLFGLFVSDVSTDRDLLWLRGLLYGVFAAALVAVDAVADFAKVRAVVEDRRGMLGALAASMPDAAASRGDSTVRTIDRRYFGASASRMAGRAMSPSPSTCCRMSACRTACIMRSAATAAA